MVCGNVKQKGDRQKFRICEDVCADKLLKVAVFFQDEVYYRTSDLQNVHSVFRLVLGLGLGFRVRFNVRVINDRHVSP